jgi:NTP pyrophosphatase (non-canonical NTP hydrolase)
MNFEDYSKLIADFDNYEKDRFVNAIYGLGLSGEAGEVSDKIKKIFRDDKGEFSEANRLELAKELGDVLWYLTAIANSLGFNLETIAVMNIAKLTSRKNRNKLGGSGDNR